MNHPIGHEVIVTGCNDCPCCDMLDMAPGYRCRLKPKDDAGGYLTIMESKKTFSPMTPQWCPLINGTTILSLKKIL